MKELIKNAWQGWLAYTESGKLAALLLVILVLFWFWKKDDWKKYRKLFIYTTIVTLCCVCPLTAALLMAYQTKFYDYQWIWNYVPITIVISLSGTLLWTSLTEKYTGTKHAAWKKVGVLSAMVCLLYLSGNMGRSIGDAGEDAYKLAQAKTVLAEITEEGQKTDIVLWAPETIMEYARALDGNICLPYGRNMWDPALNGYAYDTYGETEIAMYTWMTTAEATGMGEAYSEWILQMGINQLLLPGNLLPETLQAWEEATGCKAVMLEDYYWISLN